VFKNVKYRYSLIYATDVLKKEKEIMESEIA
jgi:hypothetical protein